MNRVRFVCLFLLLLCGTGPAVAQEAATAFVSVNVLPMDRERVLRGQTVIVQSGRILAIGPDLTPPPGARIVDGRGTAWLLPGLADMHVHVESRHELAVMLAHGITTALDMGEAPNRFVGRTRGAVASGEVPGPRVFVSLAVDGSPRFGHLVLPGPEAARSAVQLARANGYEFIKVYNGLAPETFEALVRDARAAGLGVVGHSVESVGLERQIGAGQMLVAHLEEFLYAFFRIPETPGGQGVPADEEIGRAIDFLRRSGATVTADLVTYQAIAEQWGRPEVVAGYMRRPEVRHLSPARRMEWIASGYQRRDGDLGPRAAFLARFVEALADAGIPLVAGTDAPTIPGLPVGHALHANLAALEAAGLSRFKVLASATRMPGAFIAAARPEEAAFGTVTAGARADLLLVGSNPLEDLAALRQPLGVMAAGRWHDAEGLRSLVAEAEQAFRAGGAAAP